MKLVEKVKCITVKGSREAGGGGGGTRHLTKNVL